MLGSIFHKRRKPQDLRTPSLQDIKRFRDTYARNAERRSVEPPACIERSVYKAISSQRDIHTVDFRQEDITDPQLIALAETLAEIPIMSSLDLRDNRITDDGAKALLEVLRLQIIAAKTPVPCDPKTKKPLYPQVAEFTKYITSVNLRGNEVSTEVQQELAQYTSILRREDKRLEIRAALAQMDQDSRGGLDEDEFRGVLKLLTGTEPSKKELRGMLQEYTHASDSAQGALSLENMLLARCSSPTSNKAACPPWEALVQVRHATLGTAYQAPTSRSTESTTKPATFVSKPISPPKGSPDVRSGRSVSSAYSDSSPPPSPSQCRVPSPVPSIRSADRFEKAALSYAGSDASARSPRDSSASNKFDENPSTSVSPVPSPYPTPAATPNPKASIGLTSPPVIPPLVFPPPSPDIQRGGSNSARSTSALYEEETTSTPSKSSHTKQSSNGQARGFGLSLSSSSGYSPRISELLDSPRSTTCATLLQRTGNDKLNSTPPSPDKQSFLLQESPRFDDEDLSLALGNKYEDVKTGNYSTGDDLLHSVLDQSSASERDDAFQKDKEFALDFPTSEINSRSLEASDGGIVSSPRDSFSDHGKSEALLDSSHDKGASNDFCADQISGLNTEWGDMKNEGENEGNSIIRGADYECGPEIPDSNGVDSDDAEDELEDIVEADVMKNTKSRVVMKITHWELKKGLKLTELPTEPPFRNLIALVLSENKLQDLSCFDECRFPCTLVLDLSRNRLTKIPDKTLTIFPKLQVLDIAHNKLKTISGVLECYNVRALNVSHNSIRSVTNVEHLLQLEVLSLSHNCISTAQSLRLLSLNKTLKRIDLNGNPIVEADERQRRKNITYILNIVPSLTSLGSIKIASLQSKVKKKKAPESTIRGPSFFDEQYFPTMGKTWVKMACEWLDLYQDAIMESHLEGDRDEYDQQDNDGSLDAATCTKKPLNRSQQRQKDELRSRSIAYRSRQKAPPSPPKPKASIYSFGPPLPPPSPRKKKPVQSDPAVVRRQMRRSSELSAPKHPPVDTNLLKLESKRKSRGAFDLNMSVAEKLQLAKEQAGRRSSVAASKHSNSQVKSVVPAITVETSTNQETKPESPRNFSPTKEVVAFRIEPLSAIRRQEVLEFRVEPSRTESTATSPPKTVDCRDKQSSASPKRPSVAAKGDPFLRSLAVGDFLNHATEELSTALTALNVLLSMSEKDTSDPNKLNDYRASLDALDILNEKESHILYEKTRAFGSHSQETECNEAFERLGLIKRCMRQLLEKLHDHVPGSAVIRAFCRSMRSTELRTVLADCSEFCLDTSERQHQNTQSPMKPEEQSGENVNSYGDSSSKSTDTRDTYSSPVTVNARLFGAVDPPYSSKEVDLESNPIPQPKEVTTATQSESDRHDRFTVDCTSIDGVGNNEEAEADVDLDFLEQSDSVFDTDIDSNRESIPTVQAPLRAEVEPELPISLGDDSSTFEAALLQSSDLGDISAMSLNNESDGETKLIPDDNSVTASTSNSDMDANNTHADREFTQINAEADSILDVNVSFIDHESSFMNESADDWLGEAVPTDLEVVEPNLLLVAEGSAIEQDTRENATEQSEINEFEESIILAPTEELNGVAVKNHVDFESLVECTTETSDFEAEINPTDVCTEPTYLSQAYEETVAYDELVEAQASEDSHGYEVSSENEAHEEFTASQTIEETAEFQRYDEVQNEASPNVYQEGESIYEQVSEDVTDPFDAAAIENNELGSGEDADDEEAEIFGDWEKGFDPNTNHYFWFNHATGESSWEPPEGWPYEVDEPFEAEGEYTAEEDDTGLESTEGEPVDQAYEAELGDAEVVYEATESHEAAESADDPVARASEFEPSRASEFEFDDSDLPSF